MEEALLLSERTMATLSSENLHRERLQFELDYIYQKSGLIYLGETLFDDAFGLLQKGRIDPRVLISMFPNVLQQSNITRSVNLFRGVKDQLEQLGTLPDISKALLAHCSLCTSCKHECGLNPAIHFSHKDSFQVWRR